MMNQDKSNKFICTMMEDFSLVLHKYVASEIGICLKVLQILKQTNKVITKKRVPFAKGTFHPLSSRQVAPSSRLVPRGCLHV